MKLRTVRIQSFRSIEDSGEFTLGPVTCLVGKNEAGKTALLLAMYKLNPTVKEDAKFDELEYPRRRWSEYKERSKKNPDNVITSTWELEEEEVNAIREILGTDALTSQTVTITKGYNNESYWDIKVDEKSVVSHLLTTSALSEQELESIGDERTLSGLGSKLSKIQQPTPGLANLAKIVQERFKTGDVVETAINTLEGFLPKFLYFAEYQKMAGKVAIDDLLAKKQQKSLDFAQHVFLALLDLAGTSGEDLRSMPKLERLIAELEAVSNRISKEIFSYWSQNRHLQVEFRNDMARPQDSPPFNTGYVFQTRIKNTRHGVTVGFDERSSGFVWFFSFLVWFSQIRRTYGENLVILLDDPGLGLHARAQADLLRYINEKLKPFHQVVYTTHSPFMVDLDNVQYIRTVEDVVVEERVEGTKVSEEVLGTEPDTFFPLQAALGYEITQTLFIGEHTLLVEGPADLLYLKWFSKELKRLGRTGLDDRWVIAPVGGVDKVGSFVALFGGNKIHVAVFTDFHKGQKKKLQTLKDAGIMKKGHIFTADMYAGQEEADIEDMIERKTYVALVNATYGLAGPYAIPDSKPQGVPDRVVEEVSAHFALHPDKGPFDHYRPAEFLFENSGELKAKLLDLGHAFNTFEKLFQEINQALPKGMEK